MQNGNRKTKNVSVDSLDVDIVVTLSKLKEDNERLKRRVTKLEESFKDKLASLQQLQQENETLQKHLSALISITKTELRREQTESLKDPRRMNNRTRCQHSNDDERSQYKTSYHCKRFCHDRTADRGSYRIERSSHERRSRGTGQRGSIEERVHHRSLKQRQNCDTTIDMVGKEFNGSVVQGYTQKRKRIHSPKNEGSMVDIPPSNIIMRWSRSCEMPFIQSEDLKKIYMTPLKFSDFQLISPLPSTPDQLKEKFKELENVKISPLPLLLSGNQIYDDSENNRSNGELKNNAEESVPSFSADSVNEPERNPPNLIKDNVEVQTVIETGDVEHGVFKRKRRA